MSRTHLVLLGTQIRQRREQAGWTQSELGERAGMHRNYVRSLERGERNVSIGNLLALAGAFDVDLLELLEPVIRPRHN